MFSVYQSLPANAAHLCDATGELHCKGLQLHVKTHTRSGGLSFDLFTNPFVKTFPFLESGGRTAHQNGKVQDGAENGDKEAGLSWRKR